MTIEHSTLTQKTARARVTYGSHPLKTPTTPLRHVHSPARAAQERGPLKLATPKRTSVLHDEPDSSSEDEEGGERAPPPKKRLVQTSLQLGACRLTVTKSKASGATDKLFPEIHGATSGVYHRLLGAKTNSASRAVQSRVALVEGPKKEQTFLVFGQKPLAAEPCAECGMTYQRGREEDEALHIRFHRNWLRQQTRLLSWPKNLSAKGDVFAESVALPRQLIEKHCEDQQQAKAMATIHIVDGQGASKRELQRALEILNIANDHLGAVHVSAADMALRQRKIFLYVSPRSSVLGCVLAEMVPSARRVASLGEAIACEGDPCRAVCGVSRVWVAPSARRCGVATQMIDAVCRRFIYGCPVDRSLVAFTQPTSDGRAFAEHVFGRKDFLAYTED